MKAQEVSEMHLPVEDGQNNLLNRLCVEAELVADDLAILTSIEIREDLFPLPEIKKQTREFGGT